MDYCIWSNAEAARLFQSEEVPSTVESLCLSFHREDEMLLKGCISQLKEGVSRSESGLRIVDSASGTVVGLLTLWMLRSGGQLIVSALAEPDKGQSLAGLKLLSETYLSPDFQGADLKICFQTIAENGLDVLRCDKVSIWLIDSRDSLAKRSISVCRGKPQEDEVIRIQPGFCRSYFDRLLEESHSAFEGDESPAMTVLRDLGFAAHASKAILSVPLLQGTMTGIVAFEWNEWTGELSEEARLSALMVASLCLSAAASISHQATLRQLRMREEQMAKELADAEYYVRQILPPPLTGEIDLRWMLKPSAQLGGDAFGYHWVDEDRFAIYLLDVVGHGTGAALLSISAMNSVRAQILPDTDFGNPAAVLAGLNRGFQMETQNDMTFTIWYGIYYRSSRQLCYASAGHPPALLIDPSRANQCTELSTDGLIIGHIDDFEYENAAVNVPPGAKLYVLSDGAFELERPDGAPWPYEQFVAAVRSTGSMENGEVEYLYDRAQQVLEGGELQDDFTMLRVRFPE
ncbi:MAG: PP2C family protein-serine/threonine phosphatase [Verrucomicrobiales bacterium]